MSSKTASSSTARKAPSSAAASPAGAPRRGSATAVPQSKAAARPQSPATSAGAPAAASASATPSTAPSAASTQPLPDLTTLLNLPLRVVIASSGATPQREVEGTLWTYDPLTSFVVLTSPSASSVSSGPTTAQNPPSAKRNYHLIKSTQIKSVAVLSLTPDASIPPPSTPLRSIDPSTLSARVQKAVQADQAARARVGQGVSEEAQALFDALGKTLPVRWADRSIVVMDEVIINEPYGVGDVKGGKGSTGYVERVKKVLEGERQRRAARQIGFP